MGNKWDKGHTGKASRSGMSREELAAALELGRPRLDYSEEELSDPKSFENDKRLRHLVLQHARLIHRAADDPKTTESLAGRRPNKTRKALLDMLHARKKDEARAAGLVLPGHVLDYYQRFDKLLLRGAEGPCSAELDAALEALAKRAPSAAARRYDGWLLPVANFRRVEQALIEAGLLPAPSPKASLVERGAFPQRHERP